PSRGESRHSDSVPEGQVVTLSPRPGTTVDVGTRVAMVTSSGPAPVAVPDVVGLAEDRARAALAAAGLTVLGVRGVYADAVDRGRAGGTDPGDGSAGARGYGVTVLVSHALEVPDLRAMPRDEAPDVLTVAGFTVVRESPVTDRRTADG